MTLIISPWLKEEMAKSQKSIILEDLSTMVESLIPTEILWSEFLIGGRLTQKDMTKLKEKSKQQGVWIVARHFVILTQGAL